MGNFLFCQVNFRAMSLKRGDKQTMVTVQDIQEACFFLLKKENLQSLPADAPVALPIWCQTLSETRGADYDAIKERLEGVQKQSKHLSVNSVLWLIAWAEMQALSLRLVYADEVPSDALWHFLEGCHSTEVFVL
jgi:hypothetical protein